MCGIVGYVGHRDAFPILIKGLHRLEYRGYDSAGVAVINSDDKLSVYKTKGKVKALEDFTNGKDTSGAIGIAHTRWATHGEPNDINAHPHYSQSEQLAIIHNGIIENFGVLKSDLKAKGYSFQSETDSEVLIQLIEYMKNLNSCDLFTAVQLALNEVVGSYAFAVIDKENPERIIAAKNSSPLLIGIGEEGEYFLGSDASPIIEYTDQVIYLDDGDIAVVERGCELKVVTIGNVTKQPDIKTLEMCVSELELGGYPHYMLKEIFEQPEALMRCMDGRVNVEGTKISLSGIIDNREKFREAGRIIIVACGTSWHAGLIAEHLFESFCRIPVEVEYASEFRYRNPVLFPDDIVIVISQSGETADSLAAVELVRKAGAFVYGICNVVGSSIPRNTDSGSYTHCGPEIGVASTKAFTSQVLVLTMMALAIAQERETITKEEYLSVIGELKRIPDKIEQILEKDEMIREFSQIFTYAKNFIYLGRGYNYPIALEGALKLKEISYIHAEGYPAAEMKHGPIALIDTEMPVVAIVTNNTIYDKTVSNIQEIKARKGRVVAIVDEGDETMRSIADFCIEIPAVENECLSPLLTVIPLQLLAYHIAVNKGRDVDMPRNLAKSVTVE